MGADNTGAGVVTTSGEGSFTGVTGGAKLSKMGISTYISALVGGTSMIVDQFFLSGAVAVM